jgi:hypothetical protein
VRCIQDAGEQIAGSLGDACRWNIFWHGPVMIPALMANKQS